MVRVSGAEPIYAAADLFRQRVLVNGTSFLWPEHRAWTLASIDRLLEVLRDNKEYGVPAFLNQLQQQLVNDNPDVLRVATDAMAFYLLFPNSADYGLSAKLKGVTTIIEWRHDELSLSEVSEQLLKSSFANGIGETSTWFQSGRSRHLTLLLRFAREMMDRKGDPMDPEVSRRIFLNLVAEGVPDSPVRPATLHLLFPDTFEPVIHATSRKAIIAGFFEGATGSGEQDEALADIRRRLTEQGHPTTFQFFDPPIRSLWEPLTLKPKSPASDTRRHYWKISPGGGANRWSMFRSEDLIAVNWVESGDLTDLPSDTFTDFKTAISQVPAMTRLGSQAVANAAKQLWYFSHEMCIGDFVLAYGNSSILGWAIIQGNYEYRGGNGEYPHQRSVVWQPFSVRLTATLSPELASKLKHITTVMELTQEEFADATESYDPPIGLPPIEELRAATYMDDVDLKDLVDLLHDKKQLILEGPPGSGKTWLADKLARFLTGNSFSADPDERAELVQFHQSYGYEDFVQGIRPITDADGRLTYRVVPGIFTRFCRTAASNPEKTFVLIIDEINRGNLSRIFGELLLLLEYRDKRVRLPYGSEGASEAEAFLSIPPNVYVIGTMNSTDRSLAQIDYALRRRFYFHRLLPMAHGQAPVLSRWLVQQPDISPAQAIQITGLFIALNTRIGQYLTPDFQIGHSYFMRPDIGTDAGLRRVWNRAIRPLLEEYFHGSRSGDQTLDGFRLEALLPLPTLSADPGPGEGETV